jgi:hypothetical protein
MKKRESYPKPDRTDFFGHWDISEAEKKEMGRSIQEWLDEVNRKKAEQKKKPAKKK